VPKAAEAPCIYVLAGTNGAGKSSIGGAVIRSMGADYFNPDEATRRIQSASPQLSEREANIAAWHQGKRLLEKAIATRLTFAFETTCGTWASPLLSCTSPGSALVSREADTIFPRARFVNGSSEVGST
jgi:Uncharacterized protein conserved in bacteria